jgi:hypothetical protein
MKQSNIEAKQQIAAMITILRGFCVAAVAISPMFWVPRINGPNWFVLSSTIATWALAAVIGKLRFWNAWLAALDE